jgi:hypothetical protein
VQTDPLAELADDAQHGSGFERAVTVVPARKSICPAIRNFDR